MSHIGTGYGEALLEQDLCQTAHADSADPDEMYMNRMGKINLVHRNKSFQRNASYFYTFRSSVSIIRGRGKKTNDYFLLFLTQYLLKVKSLAGIVKNKWVEKTGQWDICTK